MTLTAEQIRALAPAPGFRKIDRYLPDSYRRALEDKRTPMAVVTKSWRDGLKRVEHELGLVQRSRSVKFFTDLDDGGRLGAMHEQVPWPEDDTESFRLRLAEIARLASAGAASARRMLSLIGLSAGAEMIATITPDQASYSVTHGATTLTGSTGQGQTRGIFVKRSETAELFAGDIYDAPLRLYEQEARKRGGPNYIFDLTNTASATLPDILGDGERTYPDPVLRLETEVQIGPLMLIQTFNDPPKRAPRVIVINRTLRPGSILDVDVAAMAWNHEEGTATLLGPWSLDGKKQALMAGLSEIASNRSYFDNEPGDPAAGYAMTLRSKDGLEYDGALEDKMVDQGAIPAGTIQMPSLLGDGKSLWRVVRILPDPDGSTDIMDARFEPLPSATKLKITARWAGRRAGEFAVVVPDQFVAPEADGPLPHRLEWLDTMVNRFKLAGTVRVVPLLEDIFAGQSILAVQMELESSVRLNVGFEFDNWAEFASEASLTDTFDIGTEVELSFDSGVEFEDAFDLDNQVETRITIDSISELSDTIELQTETEASMASAARLSDSFSLSVERSTDGDPVRRPTDGGRILRPDRPRPGVILAPEVEEELRFTPTLPGRIRRLPVTIKLSSRVRLRDRMTLRKLRRPRRG